MESGGSCVELGVGHDSAPAPAPVAVAVRLVGRGDGGFAAFYENSDEFGLSEGSGGGNSRVEGA